MRFHPGDLVRYDDRGWRTVVMEFVRYELGGEDIYRAYIVSHNEDCPLIRGWYRERHLLRMPVTGTVLVRRKSNPFDVKR